MVSFGYLWVVLVCFLRMDEACLRNVAVPPVVSHVCFVRHVVVAVRSERSRNPQRAYNEPCLISLGVSGFPFSLLNWRSSIACVENSAGVDGTCSPEPVSSPFICVTSSQQTAESSQHHGGNNARKGFKFLFYSERRFAFSMLHAHMYRNPHRRNR